MDGQSDSAQGENRGDWGPFGRPLFDDPKARRLARVGVVDIGSNSVRLVVFDGAARSPAYFYNEKVMCGLGAGLTETGHLNVQGKERCLSAMARFKALAIGMGLPPLTAVATAAMRDASDGPAFRAQIERETGIKIWVIDGEEEARLSAQGVLLGWPGASGMVCDIGGSSMELAELSGGQVGKRHTSPLGPLRFKDLDGGRKARERHVHKHIAALAEKMQWNGERIYLVGGSWRAIARLDMERRAYPLHVQHEYRMTCEDVLETLKFIEKADLEALRSTCSISSARMSLVPYAAEVLAELISAFKPKDIAISSYGIREGLLYEQMPQRLRDRDPLIEACRFSEAKDARRPGFGKTLYNFVLPLFQDATPMRLRLVKAACLLHDVSWRDHPDYRAQTCFHNVTQAELSGLNHPERVFLGLALLHRYKNKRDGLDFEPLFALISAEDQRRAEILGKAMRFGAMLWMPHDDERAAAALEWDADSGRLLLKLTQDSAPLFGEVAEARFNALGRAFGAQELSTKIGAL
ncbi:Ppx/GppA family phosphatase [Salipiger sp. 1_MG-2023]|uniref:Ppx/GppA family phosphatase n=1 Tax=Salipiger sp. 1_MG-2023 TaxID=3062665 RepID=UPI0026E1DBFA|nr:Ppx/GppA family phosphatase [Salipiger sp. 1_MG-2023]MDO6586489.1 Ppx/GppA family phosphatase [Salipiger sp. 1_MG-2023]